MKIHTKHLALCEKGRKFNKTHNTIYKLQEEPIEPTGKMEKFFMFVFVNFAYFGQCIVFCMWLPVCGEHKEVEIYFLGQNEV